MEIENPLLIPNLIWKIALAVTVLLIVIRVGLHVAAKNRRDRMAAKGVERVDNEDEHGDEHG